jgi:protein-S-isoprenylcysteine O-methyltransferase Ste14
MTEIAATIEISRTPEDVFAYAIDFSHFPEWQGGVVAARRRDTGPLSVGSTAVVTRRVGPRTVSLTQQITELNRPKTWTVRSVGGPLVGTARATIEPLDNGKHSRVTIALDFEGRGIGRLFVPLVVRPQARKQLPRNEQKLKELLEQRVVAVDDGACNRGAEASRSSVVTTNRFVVVLLFGFVLLYLPARLFSFVSWPARIGASQVGGILMCGAGAAIALWCVFNFAVIGRGTPAPFAAPPRLVTRGPYRFVRNPMYIGVGVFFAGAAVFYQSRLLLAYLVLFVTASHLFVVWYEEPTLCRAFGNEYSRYCSRVRRWWPHP